MKKAERIEKLPVYLFAQIDRAKREAIAKGVDIIDFGVGDPDLPTPNHIIEALSRAAKDPKNHRYPSYEGMLKFREAAASWYKKRFQVELDPEREVLTLIGAKEGIGHIPLAFINEGDIALIPDPGYPVYRAGVTLAGGIPHSIPLLKENNFLPDLGAIDRKIAKKVKLIFLNYPNNPTSAVAGKDFFKKVVAFAKENDVIVCHDATYSELGYDGYKPPSFLEVEGAKEVGIEFHSLSKTYNMTGWRIGFAVGNSDILAGLGSIKTNVDSGVFQAIQYAGIEALAGPQECIAQNVATYKERRDILVEGLNRLGWGVSLPKVAFYAWIPVPQRYTSAKLCEVLLEKCGIVMTPGNGFGKSGEGYIRAALTVDKSRIEEAVRRIENLKL
ncbi:LL-diaminopimelate aminotransferase [bacterium]|nr:LL-diaminopimelate aminotransferase [bacterium]MCG2677481.1 LL-diaminopimelate aminotransferase [bacterium]